MGVTALVMAGGRGTRMKSEEEKPLLRVGGKLLIEHVLNTLRLLSACLKRNIERKTLKIFTHYFEEPEAFPQNRQTSLILRRWRFPPRAGGISLLGENFVFSGGALFAGSIGRTDFPGASFEEIMQSIKTKLMTLPDRFKVHPGHGSPTTIGEEKKHNPFLH